MHILYARRFVVLAAFSFLCFIQNVSWFIFASFSNEAEAFYGVSEWWINFCLLLGPFGFLLFFPLVVSVLEKVGIFAASVCGSLLVLCCAWLRVISLLNPPKLWWVVVIGQFLTGCAGPIVQAVPPKLSAQWFGPKERAWSTSVSVVANSVGSAAGFLLALSVFSLQDVATQIWIQFGAALFCFILTLLFVRDHPPTPCSNSSDRLTADIPLLPSLKALAKNPSFLVLGFSVGLSQGVFSNWAALLGLLLVDQSNPTVEQQHFAAWVGFSVVLASVVGGVIVGWLVGFMKKLRYKLIIVLSFLISGGLFVLVNLQLLNTIPFNRWVLGVSITLAGLIFNCSYPLFYEMAVEVAYPVPEGVVGALVGLSMNVFSIPFFFLQDYVPAAVVNWVNAGSAVFFGLLLILALKESYKRHAVDLEPQIPKSGAELN